MQKAAVSEPIQAIAAAGIAARATRAPIIATIAPPITTWTCGGCVAKAQVGSDDQSAPSPTASATANHFGRAAWRCGCCPRTAASSARRHDTKLTKVTTRPADHQPVVDRAVHRPGDDQGGGDRDDREKGREQGASLDLAVVEMRLPKPVVAEVEAERSRRLFERREFGRAGVGGKRRVEHRTHRPQVSLP